jgi:KTSC domain
VGPDPQWLPAPSRTIARYAYDAQLQRLYLEFRNHDIGYYTHIAPSTYSEFESAVSKGTFIRDQLRGNPAFPWVKVAYVRRARCG